VRHTALAGQPAATVSAPDEMAASVLAGLNPARPERRHRPGPLGAGLTSSTQLMVVSTTGAAALATGSAVVRPGQLRLSPDPPNEVSVITSGRSGS
jgi:SulP family sulfate permease